MAFCAKCGNQLDVDTKFCDKCGQSVDEVQSPAVVTPYSVPATTAAPPMQKVPPRVKKPKGVMSKVFGIVLLAAVIVGLNFIGIPGYVAALVIGALSSMSLLGKNQNGRVREKLALIAAFIIGAIAYYIASAQAYGMYVGAVVFLAAGFGLTRLYKIAKPDHRLWFAEMLPTVVRFALLERIGGAVSGLGFAFHVGSMAISVRYIEAFVFLIAYVILQVKVEQQISVPGEGYGQRNYVAAKHKGLKNFGKVAAVAVIAIMWLNPAHIIVFDNIKNSVMDSLMVFSVNDKTTIETISDFNGTSLFFFDSPAPVTNELEAYTLLSEYDKQLTGEYKFASSEKLSNGNTVYSFSQTSKGIPIYGASKKLVVDQNNTPLYALGPTRLGVGNLTADDDIGDKQAAQAAQSFFEGEGAKIGQLTKTWKLSADGYNDAYQLVYAAPVTFSGDDYALEKANVFFSAVSGSVVDIDVGDADGQLADIFEQVKSKGKFSDADFDAIIQSADTIISGVDANAWIYRDVLMQECQRYYANQGNEKLGKNNANAFMNAFKASGVSKKNSDEGVVKVTMGTNKATVKGSLNYPYAIKQILITHTDNTTQQYTFKSDVPVVLTVSKMSGETVLTLPVFGEATFDIYPAGHDGEYVVTIQAGSEYQSNEKAVSAPIIPGTLAIQTLAAAPASQWLYGRAQASYELTLKQLDTDLRIEGGDRINKMLRSIEAAYNADNGARYISLYRLDELGRMLHDQDYIRMMESMSPYYAKLLDAALSGNTLGLLAQTYLSAYRVANDVWVSLAGGSKEFGDFGQFQDAMAESAGKLMSTSPDKTAIAFFLLGTEGDFMDWINNFDKRMLHLDGTTLKLHPRGSTVKGDKTFVKVDATISGNGAPIHKTATIIIQHFGDISSRFSKEESGDWWDMVSRLKQFWTAGDYLGLDLSKLKFEIPAYGGEELPRAADTTPTKRISDPIGDDEAIIFIPGIAGSDLKVGHDDVWPEAATDILSGDDNLYRLLIDNNGNSVELVSAQGDGVVYIHTYQKICNRLKEEFERPARTGSHDSASGPREIKFFAYDWRLSGEDNAKKLCAFVKGLGYKKVNFIAHSTGGLLALSYLAERKTDNSLPEVNKFITIATPWLGAPKAAYVFTTGDFGVGSFWADLVSMGGWPTSGEQHQPLKQIRQLSSHFPGVYQLLPPNTIKNNWLRIEKKGTTYEKDAYKIIINTMELVTATYAKASIPAPNPSAPSPSGDGGPTGYLETVVQPETKKFFLSKAQLFQEKIAASLPLLATVDAYVLAGDGVATIQSVVIDESGKYVFTSETPEGDETVPTWSANANGKLPKKVFYTNKYKNVNHSALPGYIFVINDVVKILKGEEISS